MCWYLECLEVARDGLVDELDVLVGHVAHLVVDGLEIGKLGIGEYARYGLGEQLELLTDVVEALLDNLTLELAEQRRGVLLVALEHAGVALLRLLDLLLAELLRAELVQVVHVVLVEQDGALQVALGLLEHHAALAAHARKHLREVEEHRVAVGLVALQLRVQIGDRFCGLQTKKQMRQE